MIGSSSFELEYSTYEEVLQLVLARQAVLARRAAAAAGGDVAAQDAAAAAAVQQAAAFAADAGEILQGIRRLQPLPAVLMTSTWGQVAERALPQGSSTCAVCLCEMEEEAAVVQLRCRHTFCEGCVQQVCTMSAAQRRVAACPMCRGAIE